MRRPRRLPPGPPHPEAGLRRPPTTTTTPQTKAPADPRAASVERWFNRDEQAWVVQTLDQNGYAIGAATYISVRNGGKALAIEEQLYRQDLIAFDESA